MQTVYGVASNSNPLDGNTPHARMICCGMLCANF